MAEEQQISRVIITFNEPGSAHFGLQFEGTVSPQQMIAMARQIDLVFGNEFLMRNIAEQAAKAQEKLAVAKGGIIKPDGSKGRL